MKMNSSLQRGIWKNRYIYLLATVSIVAGIFFGSSLTPVNDKGSIQAEIFPGLQALESGKNTNEYVKKQLIFCGDFPKDSKNRYNCYKSLGEHLTSKLDFKTIVTSLEASGLDCHDEMHYVVNSEYKKGATMQEIWSQCSDACFGACYHGGLEGLIENRELAGKDDEVILQALQQECDSIKNPYSILQYQCFHGVGHAFMLITDGDLPASLSMCDGLKEFSDNCYEGVFMENIPTSKTAQHTKSFIRPDDLLYPCNAIESKYQSTCYAFQVSYITQSADIDPEKPYTACLLIPEEFRSTCYSQSSIPHFDMTDPGQLEIREFCSKFPGGDPKKGCILGGIAGFADRYPGNIQKLSEAYAYCSLVDEEYKSSCYLEAFKIMRQFIQENSSQDIQCGKITEEKYKQLCLKN